MNFLDPLDPRHPDIVERLMARQQLNPAHFRVRTPHPSDAAPLPITRLNVEMLLDSHMIECAMQHGKWWAISRNGRTRRWKRNPLRIYLPYKFGFRGRNAITEADFEVRL